MPAVPPPRVSLFVRAASRLMARLLGAGLPLGPLVLHARLDMLTDRARHQPVFELRGDSTAA
jgi:hypothetical protein